VTKERICVLTFNRPGSAANFLDRPTLDEFRSELDFIARDSSLRGLVITSAKPSIFLAGADLAFFAGQRREEDLRAYLELGQTAINHLATLPIPKVAAIHGACLGGGYEVCLACNGRIASAARATKIGLPETTLGLLPAWGGTTRLPRLIGLKAALDLILTGKTLTAEQALAAGLVDKVVSPEKLEETARQRILSNQVRPARSADKPLLTTVPLEPIAQSQRDIILRKTRGHNSAMLKALDVAAASMDSIDASLARERDAFMELIQSEPTQNRLRLFFLREHAKKADKNAAALPAIKRIGVLGAGTMGAGIAYWTSSRGLTVSLRDVDDAATTRGCERVTELYAEGARRGLFTPEEARAGRERITPETTDAAFAGADLIVEAVVESLEAKSEVFRRLDEIAAPTAILASNTSALSISEIAAATRRPERVLGLHFFNPVPQMSLVEIVAGRETDAVVLERARRFVQQIGKLPVLVKDSPGFVVNRVLMPYLMEAVRLLTTSASREEIDEAMLDFGMAMGPLRVIDEVGIDVTLHIVETLERHFGERDRPPQVLRDMLQAGRFGRKKGSGFFLYGAARPDAPKSAGSQLAPKLTVTDDSAAVLSRSALQERMVLLMINEAARCVEETVVSEPADLDLAMMEGAGFGPFLGGPLRYADTVGTQALVASMDSLAQHEGARFAPCDLLRGFARRGVRFYPS
jgi:3-hydroxyacyl-CoA dehydrogenase/enoyl-CoA hydratase/3-hydroxybutyryl-CoA epimerase